MIDALAEEGNCSEGAIAFARQLIADKAPLKKVRDRDDKLAPARGEPEIFEAIRKANARKFRGFEALGCQRSTRSRTPSTCRSTKA